MRRLGCSRLGADEHEIIVGKVLQLLKFAPLHFAPKNSSFIEAWFETAVDAPLLQCGDPFSTRRQLSMTRPTLTVPSDCIVVSVDCPRDSMLCFSTEIKSRTSIISPVVAIVSSGGKKILLPSPPFPHRLRGTT